MPFFSEQEFFRGNDNGFYFVKQIDEWSEIWWVGEHILGNFVNVFRGRLSVSRDGECRWEGRFYDVPKGLTCNAGNLELIGVPSSRGAFVIARENLDTLFGARIWTPGFTREFSDVSAEKVCPGFEGVSLENLSGLWVGDDLGFYYVHDLRDTNEFVWFAEHPSAEPREPGAPRGRQWANVFIGEREGNSATGRWSDVPKGEIDQHGTLQLSIVDEETIRIISQTGGYGGRILRRRRSRGRQDVRIIFRTLEILNQQERKSGGDDPYIEFLIAKMDGEAVDPSRLGESEAVVRSELVNTLPRSQPRGSTIDLSAHIEPQAAELFPINGARIDEMPTVLAIAVRCWERDRGGPSYGNSREDQWARWRDSLSSNINRDLQRAGSSPDFHRHAGIMWSRFRWKNQDDFVGYDTKVFSWQDLRNLASSGGDSIIFDCIGSGAHYQVTVRLEVEDCSIRLNPGCP